MLPGLLFLLLEWLPAGFCSCFCCYFIVFTSHVFVVVFIIFVITNVVFVNIFNIVIINVSCCFYPY